MIECRNFYPNNFKFCKRFLWDSLFAKATKSAGKDTANMKSW